MILLLAFVLQAQDRLPVPPEADQAQAAKVVRDVFSAEFAKTAPADRVLLARKLLGQTEQTKDDPATRYVLLREARDLANQAGDLALALEAIDGLCKVYAVEAGPLRAGALAAAAKGARMPEECRIFAQEAIKMAAAACAADDYESAEKALATGAPLARKSQDAGLASRMAAKTKETNDLKSKFAALKKARETLASTPDDGPANFAVGRYLCFQKGDWAGGLPLLAKGTDPALKGLAEQELAKPPEPSTQLALADAWWDTAEKDASVKDAIRDHANLWYSQALPKLSGLLKSKAQKRMLEFTAARLARGDWVDCTDFKHFKHNVHAQNPVVINTRVGFQNTTRFEDFPKGEFDAVTMHLKLDLTPKARIYVMLDSDTVAAFVSAGTGTFGWAKRDSLRSNWSPAVEDKCEHPDDCTLTIVAAAGEYILYCDNQERGRVPATRATISELTFNNHSGDVTIERLKFRRIP